ncbi:hypothetical protein CYLTODRAFT_492220 [Cylindrobasidium torrendii FP15055 ss-10]|uniref:DUF6533 domain-containing protein n=1 Tax=Cylindrobasidium torrendii FP15055 ss-10 TaxID=1314674 RepID=A0A0D7B4R7_9AGAR|nr:hypothetical protein CYLTODRAFT_492220 [Cylindrobasidium torrendii FP15055 ss-10]
MEETIEQVFLHQYAEGYVSAAGLTLLLYDHALTFQDEVSLIWAAPSTLPKWLFLFMRYTVPAIIIVCISQLTAGIDAFGAVFCKAFLAFATCVGVVTIAMGNFLVLLHFWNLWNRNTRIMIWTMGLFVTCQLATIGCAAKVISTLIRNIGWSDQLNMCVMTGREDIALAWIPGAFFEAIILTLVIYKGLTKTKLNDEAEDNLSNGLYFHGIAYFATLFVLRLVNFVAGLVAPMSLVFIVVYFIWCSTTIAVTRLMLSLRAAAREVHRSRQAAAMNRTGGRMEIQVVESTRVHEVVSSYPRFHDSSSFEYDAR